MPRRLQHAQGVVEFGLIIAAAAIVSIAGVSAMTRAQEAYWGASTPTFAAPTPGTGTFIHPTNIAQPTCTPSLPGPVPVGGWLACDTTVSDVYSSVADRNPPLGTIDWQLNGASIATCTLSPVTSSQSRCAAPALNWLAPAAYVGSTRGLVVMYVRTSNHQNSNTTAVNVQFTVNLQWSVGCVNDLNAAFGAVYQVEIGHPIRCSVTLKDGSGGVGYVPAGGTPITWAVTNSPANDGLGMFTCSATTALPGGPMWTGTAPCTPPTIPPAGVASIVCTTDATGTCSVVYRHLYDSFLKGVGWNPVMTLTGSGGSANYNLYTVRSSPGPHSSGIVVLCVSSDPHTVVPPWPTGDVHTKFGNAKFGNGTSGGTQDVDIFGAPRTTTLSCTVWVYDATAHDNPAVNGSVDPTHQEAFPPMGTVNVNFYNGVTTLTPASCTLARVDTAANPQHAPGQAPFMSSCATGSFSISGSVGGPQEYVNVTYDGEPPGTPGGPGHSQAWSPVPGAVPGYRFNVDFT